MTRRTEFIGPAYYTSMGFAVPASVGAGMASPTTRALVIVGDGAFQMTGMELSTVGAAGAQPDRGGLEQPRLHDRAVPTGRAVQRHPRVGGSTRFPRSSACGLGIEVRTEGELDEALGRALANTGSFSLLNVHLDPWDRSPALERLAGRLSKMV